MAGQGGVMRDTVAGPEVSLVFPPLVTTNFSNYYPSSALLSAYLKAHGVGTAQADLNERFAHYLLQPKMLEQLGQGNFFPGTDRMPLEAMPCVSARLLLRLRDQLFDNSGRDHFGATSPGPTHLLVQMAEVYHQTLDLAALQGPGFYDTPAAKFCLGFYEASGYLESLAPGINTVGISVPIGPQLVPALILARHIKRHRQGVRVVLGGPTLSLMNIEDLNTLLTTVPEIDAVVRFDGEIPLLELVRQQQRQEWKPTEVSAVSSLVNGKVCHTAPVPGPELRSLPFADYDKDMMASLSDPEIGIVQARGCYWGKCAYCDYVELYKGSRAYRTQTPDRFVEEMRHQVAVHGRNRFSIITESIPPAFARRISDAILTSGLDVSWLSFAMVDKRFTAETLRLIADSGCELLEIGVESMTDRVLALVEKAATREMNERFIRDATAAGVRLKLNLIPDLPSTTYREALDSLGEFQKLADCIDRVGVYPFEPTRSSRIGRDPEYYSLTTLELGDAAGQSQFPANHLISRDPAMTDSERKDVHARFFQFREQINARRSAEKCQTFRFEDVEFERPLRLLEEHLDFIEVEDGIQGYHALTRQQFHIPQAWATELMNLRAARSFTLGDLIGQFALRSDGEAFCRQLVKFHTLAPCSEEKTQPPSSEKGALPVQSVPMGVRSKLRRTVVPKELPIFERLGNG